MMQITDLIDRNKFYSILFIYKMNWLPWITSYDTLKRNVISDIKKGNKNFKAIQKGKRTGKRYLIQGDTLLKLIKKSKEGNLIF